MKNLIIFVSLLPFFCFSQSIDVFVDGTTFEFSDGETYEVNTINFIEFIDLRIENNTGSQQSFKLERILPSSNNWEDVFMTWSTPFDISQNENYMIDQTPSWISAQPITIPDGEVIYTILRYDAMVDGCDNFLYYVLNNDVRVDSFNINLCKVVIGLDEKAHQNISIYPNPSSTELNVSFQNQFPDKITLHNIIGEKIAEVDAKQSVVIPTVNLASGVYYLSWKIEGMSLKRKFLVQH